MKIADLFSQNSIMLNCTFGTKNEAIDTAIKLMSQSNIINNIDKFAEGVYQREAEGSTGIGEGIAIPHCKSDAVSKPGIVALKIDEGVDFDSLDGQKADLLFMIAAPMSDDNIHLDVLSRLSVLLVNEEFTNDLRNAESVDEFINIINKAENEIELKDFNILAVTACPTGIAHTYMAAETLEKKAREIGCSIKVETRGSGGVKNALTSEDIDNADAIIIAADTSVPMNRFDGKKVIICKVSDGIRKAEDLINKAISGDIPIYKHDDTDSSHEDKSKENVHKIYKHLMNGVSYMLPFVVGGGILIALAFLIDSILIDINQPPLALIEKYKTMDAINSNFGTLTPLSEFLKAKVGGLAFSFMMPVLSGFIAKSIADRPGLLLGFLGGTIAYNGSSGFLGAILAGFLAGYIIILLKKVFSILPKSMDGIKPVLLYPLFGILIEGAVMIFAIEPVVGLVNILINTGLSSLSQANLVFVGALVGGMMAVDMGGPFNKAAYLFGTAQIAAGNYEIMASVMVGGMVPPIAIAISTLLFKDQYTDKQKKAGITNFVMGLSFITEGAIPFAAADPIRVIPSCILGSAIAGALAQVFKCTLMAPHGGIFVLPVIGNGLMFLTALIIGSIFTAIILGILKKHT